MKRVTPFQLTWEEHEFLDDKGFTTLGNHKIDSELIKKLEYILAEQQLFR